VAALRRSRFGRQLIASRDSEAAFATLGGNLLRTKVLVFALAAGVAGLGGALYGMQLRAVTADQFSFVAGLPIFLIAVIGGLGAVGAGVFTGIAYVVPVQLLGGLAPWAESVVAMLPGLAGIALARNPDGIVAGMRRDWASRLRRLRRVRRPQKSTVEVPVEWWGVRRPWREHDGEVLDRGVGAG
jgi:branched-chain amino acid transport system permease protein